MRLSSVFDGSQIFTADWEPLNTCIVDLERCASYSPDEPGMCACVHERAYRSLRGAMLDRDRPLRTNGSGDAQFDKAGAGEGAPFTGALGGLSVPSLGGVGVGVGVAEVAEVAGAPPVAGAAELAAADALVAGSAAPFFVHTTRPKRAALWKLPWPKMGDQETPPLFFMA